MIACEPRPARDVIAGVAVDHQFTPVNHSSIGPEDHCRCGFRPRGWLEWSKHFADALLAAGVTMPGVTEREKARARWCEKVLKRGLFGTEWKCCLRAGHDGECR